MRKRNAGPSDEQANDAQLCAEIRQRISTLAVLIGKADRRDIVVEFQIRKDEKGNWIVAQCDLRKRL